MRISHKHGFIFLSFPRTASRTMRTVLDPASDVYSVHITEISEENPYYHHSPAHYVEQVFIADGRDPGDYFKFAFVRNPYTRMTSMHRWHVNLLKMNKRPVVEFKEFLREAHTLFVGEQRTYTHPYDMRSPFQYFACRPDGELFLDKVYKFEELRESVDDICTRLGIPNAAALPEVGKFKQKSAAEYYDDETHALVSEVYAWEIAEFGYSLDDLG